ncbi:hypothetical protein GCM10027063_43730 [Promicromonospora xylanilytica]
MAKPAHTEASSIPLGCNAYVDETKARGYVLAVVFVPPRDVHTLRAALRGLRAAGSRSIHFHKANNAQRAAVVDALVTYGVSAMIITNRTHPRTPPREASIRALARQAVQLEVALLVLERDQTIEGKDRRWLFEELNKTSVRYEHRDRHEDPLLWAADAVAWCWQHGEPWRQRATPLIAQHVDAQSVLPGRP